MSLKIIERKVVIELNDTVEDWGLYNCDEELEAKSREAAIAINEALMNAINSGANRNVAQGIATSTMENYYECGAIDSEPIYHLYHILDTVYGKKGGE